MKSRNTVIGIIAVLIIFVGIPLFIATSTSIVSGFNLFGSGNLRLLSTPDNKDLEDKINDFARKNGFRVDFTYMGDLEITQELNNNPDDYDAVWVSNSLWLYTLKDSKLISESKGISVSPVVMGIRKSKAYDLGLVGKDVTNMDIVNLIKSEKISYVMGTVTRTNDGASSYFGFLNALAGNPQVLTKEMVTNPTTIDNLKALFKGVQRSSGSDEYLSELFLTGNVKYDAIIGSESFLIGLNKKMEANGEHDLLYLIYPTDGVPINDSALAFINHYDNDAKKNNYLLLQQYLRSADGQKELEKLGRRTWYGGVKEKADNSIFNKDWGIDTSEYLTSTKFPSRDMITFALNVYIEELRKPAHTVFCLDYSGSMYGSGYNDLTNAMNYILDYDKASVDQLQFSKKDKITVIPFSDKNINKWQTNNGKETRQLINNINSLSPGGGTAIYGCSIEGLKILSKESDDYLKTIILMTDGENNRGSYEDLRQQYNYIRGEIPIYSITFGDASEYELSRIAKLSNAKVFDGKRDLLAAFKEVRGYF